MSYTIPRTDICMADAMPFSQHWEVRIPVAIEDIDDYGHALQSAYSSFKAGDLVNICSFERSGGDWKRLREVASLRVVACDNRKIETVFVTSVIKVKDDKGDPKNVDSIVLEVVKVGNAFEVKDHLGNTLEAFVEQTQAEAYRDRHSPKTIADASKQDRTGWSIHRGFQGRSVVKNEDGEVIREFRKREDAEVFISTGRAPEQKAA